MKREWCVWMPWFDIQLKNRKSRHLGHLKPWHPDTIQLSNTRFDVATSNKTTYMRKLNLDRYTRSPFSQYSEPATPSLPLNFKELLYANLTTKPITDMQFVWLPWSDMQLDSSNNTHNHQNGISQ